MIIEELVTVNRLLSMQALFWVLQREEWSGSSLTGYQSTSYSILKDSNFHQRAIHFSFVYTLEAYYSMQLQLYIPAVSFVLYISTVATQKKPKPNNAISATDRYASSYIFTKARKSNAKPNYNAGNDSCTVRSAYHRRRIIYKRIYFYFCATASTWQHTTLTTDIHAPGGIRTHNPSRRAAADLRLRPSGQWDRHNRILQLLIYAAVKSSEEGHYKTRFCKHDYELLWSKEPLNTWTDWITGLIE